MMRTSESGYQGRVLFSFGASHALRSANSNHHGSDLLINLRNIDANRVETLARQACGAPASGKPNLQGSPIRRGGDRAVKQRLT
jgi:hypothetical protein